MAQDVDPTLVDQVARAAVAAHRGRRGPLLPVLHTVAERLGYVPAQAVRIIADELNLSRADVHGVVTFYKDLRTEPAPAVVVQVCRAEACQAVGGQTLMDDARARVAVRLEETFCLGNCALGPSATVAGRLYGRLTSDRLCALVGAAVDASAEQATP